MARHGGRAVTLSFMKAFAAITTLLLACGTVCAQSTGEIVEKARALDRKLRAAEALELYLQAEKLAPENVRVLAAIARQYRHLMADAARRDEKLRLGGLALAYGQRAAALAPNDSEAQLSPAISYGKMVPLVGSTEQVAISGRIKEAADKALQLDPRNHIAWHVLGRWHQGYAEVTGVRRVLGELRFGKLPDSTYEDAARCFEKAIEADPGRLIHYIELGRTYAQMGRPAEARRLIEKGLAMPDVEKDDPDIKQRGRETLAKLR